MRRTILTAILLFIVLSASAQSKTMTLNECMQYAVEHSPKINKQEARNTIYNQDYMEAIGRLLPSINANSDLNLNFGRGLDQNTNTYTSVNSLSNSYGLNSSLTLFDGFSNIARVRMQKAGKLMGKQQLEEIKDMVAYETMQAFYNVLYYTELVKYTEQELEKSTANLKQVQRMEELGLKGSPDVAEMAAKEAEDAYNLTRQENILAIAMIKLKEAMNFPVHEDLVVSEDSDEILIAKTDESAKDIYEQSRQFNPTLQISETSLERQQLALQTARGGIYPRLSASAGINTNYFSTRNSSELQKSFDEQFNGKVGKYVSISLSVPIFNGFSNSANIKRSKAQIKIAQAEQEETLRMLYSDMEQAVADMNGQADQYYQAKRQVEAMTIAHHVNEQKYNQGLVSAIELHTSANRVIKSRADELNAHLQYRLKKQLVEYYKGIPYIK